MGKDYYYFFNYSPTTSPWQPQLLRASQLQDASPLPVKATDHHISLLHGYSDLSEITSTSSPLTQSPVLLPSSRQQRHAHRKQAVSLLRQRWCLCLLLTENYCNIYCKGLNQGMRLTLGREKEHHTAHCEVTFKKLGEKKTHPKNLFSTFMQGRYKKITQKLPAAYCLHSGWLCPWQQQGD